MADQILTQQDFINGKVDFGSLGEATNEAKVVTPRYGDQYKSAPLAIKEIEDNGIAAVAALNAKADQVVAQGFYKGYTTEALLLAAKPAVAEMRARADDTRKIYRWNRTSAEGVTPVTGTWVDTGLSDKDLAAVDATTKANAAEANAKGYVNANDGATRYSSSAFYDAKYYSAYGTATASTNSAATDLIPVKAGDVVTVFTRVSSSTYAAILVYNSSGTFVRSVLPSVFSTPTETTTTIEANGFVRSQWMGAPLSDKDGVAKVVINEGSHRFLTDALLPAAVAPLIQNKADKYKTLIIDNSSFVIGGVGFDGAETTSNLRARSPVYKLNVGDVIEISRPTGSTFQFGWNTASSAVIPFISGQFKAPESMQFTIAGGLEYVRFVFRKNPETEITASDLDTIKSQVLIKVNNKVIYSDDLVIELGKTNNRVLALENEPVHAFNSTFRASSEASSGIVSFIDDDGKSAIYDILDPIYKANDVPYACAIITSAIGTTGYLTLPQLKTLAENQQMFEVMNHTFAHSNLSNLTEEKIHEELQKGKIWLRDNGFLDDGFVLPYGGDNALVRKVVAQYYKACYDFASGAATIFTLTPSTIRNSLIKRSSFGIDADRLTSHKAAIDFVAANGGWLVITTHVANAGYWDSTSAADLVELINYIKSKNCKIVKPRDGFQIMGNFIENDSGFRITAKGETLNTAW